MPFHPSTKFKIQKYYRNGLRWGICNNLDEYKSITTKSIIHQIALHVNGNNRRASYSGMCFDSLGVEQIPSEIEKFIENKNIITSIYRIQA